MATINRSGLYPGEPNPAQPLTQAKPDAAAPRSASSKAPALAWVGILMALVILRLIYELS